MTTAATAPASAPAARATAAALPRRRQQQHHHRRHCRAFGVAVCASSSDAPLLEVKGLEAVIAATGQQILKGVNLTLRAGEVRLFAFLNEKERETEGVELEGNKKKKENSDDKGALLFFLLSLPPLFFLPSPRPFAAKAAPTGSRRPFAIRRQIRALAAAEARERGPLRALPRAQCSAERGGGGALLEARTRRGWGGPTRHGRSARLDGWASRRVGLPRRGERQPRLPWPRARSAKGGQRGPTRRDSDDDGASASKRKKKQKQKKTSSFS